MQVGAEAIGEEAMREKEIGYVIWRRMKPEAQEGQTPFFLKWFKEWYRDGRTLTAQSAKQALETRQRRMDKFSQEFEWKILPKGMKP